MHLNMNNILAYPHYLIRSDIELAGCMHSGLFNASSRECLECVDCIDCRWLNDIEDLPLTEASTNRQLLDALEHAIISVTAQVTRLEHKPLTCTCDACVWLSDARTLFDQTH